MPPLAHAGRWHHHLRPVRGGHPLPRWLGRQALTLGREAGGRVTEDEGPDDIVVLNGRVGVSLFDPRDPHCTKCGYHLSGPVALVMLTGPDGEHALAAFCLRCAMLDPEVRQHVA